MTNRAERYPISHSVPLLSIPTPRWLSLSSHHPKNIFYTHARCSCLPRSSPHPSSRAHQARAAALPAQGHPTNTHHGTTLAQEASAQRARSSATSFSKHRQSLFLVCLCRREQEAGSWSAGRRAQPVLPPFLSPPAFFPRMLPARLHLQQSHGTCRNTSLPAPGTVSPVTDRQAPASHGAAHQTPLS